MPEAITLATWTRFLDTAEPMHALVAERSGQLLGLAHFLFHRTTTSTSDNCYMQDLYTTESSRGTGIGRALIERVYTEAKKAGAGVSTGRPTRPIPTPCCSTTRWRRSPVSSCTASCFEGPHPNAARDTDAATHNATIGKADQRAISKPNATAAMAMSSTSCTALIQTGS